MNAQEAELDRRATLRREIEHRLAQAEVTYVDLLEFAEWGQDRIAELLGFGHDVEAILNDYLPQALGDDEEHGDALEIAAVARRLAQLWEDVARWTLRCRSVRVDPRAERAVDLLSTINANMLDEIWDFGHRVLPNVEAAIRKYEAGEEEVVVEDMTLAVTADVDEFSEEMDRLARELGL